MTNYQHKVKSKSYGDFESSGHGSAGKRTNQQRKAAKREYTELLRSKANSIHVFTDGACKGNPGPAGSGMHVVVPPRLHDRHSDSDGADESRTFYIAGWQHVGRATNQIAELNAIRMFFAYFNSADSNDVARGILWDRVDSVELFSDSKYSVGLLTRGWNASKNVDLVQRAKRELAIFRRTRPTVPVTIQWIPGHVDIQGNEMADTFANRGRAEAHTSDICVRTVVH
jgi:ribonuclease HI